MCVLEIDFVNVIGSIVARGAKCCETVFWV